MGPAARRRTKGAAGVAACTGLYIVGAALVGGSDFWKHLWADVWWTAASGVAALACFTTSLAATAAHRRAAWRWFGFGAAAWFIGMLVWSENELGLDWLTPFPSIADVFFDAIAPCFVVGCYRYGQDRPSVALSFKQAGDLAMIACVLMPVAALALFGPVMETHEAGLYVVAALAYPVLHGSALVFGLVIWWQHVWGAWRWVLGLQLAAMGLLAVVTTLYAETLLGRRYEAGAAMDPLWIACFALMTWAAREERAIAREVGEAERVDDRLDDTPAADALVPAVAVLIAVVAALAFRDRWHGPMVVVGGIAGLGLALAISVRLSAGQLLERELRTRMRADSERARRLETELMHAQRLQAIGTLAGGVAHDLRNLIQIMIVGHTMVKSRLSRGQPAGSALDEVERAMWRAADLSARLLDLSRRGPGRVTTIDPARLLEDVAPLLEKVLPDSIDLEIHVAPGVPMVSGDDAGLEHALINLGLNARDAMKGRQGRIRISVDRGEISGVAGRAVVFCVDDDGPGIPPDVLPRLFEPFFTTKPPGEGTGLGLARVEALAAEHHGVVTASNRPGGGARFQLALPAAPATEQRPRRTTAPPTATVLVVDNDEARRLLVTGALERNGFHVLVAEGRDDALVAARAHHKDIAVIVADAGSGLVGAEALDALRATGSHAPVILVTGTDATPSGEYAAVVTQSQDPGGLISAVQKNVRAA
jgi:signal transduction histidine kinase/CheY-like chemotaxis protein